MRWALVRAAAVTVLAALVLAGQAPRVGADPIIDTEAQATAIATKLGQLNSQLIVLSGQVADAQHAVEVATAATAKALDQQSTEMTNRVSFFKLAEEAEGEAEGGQGEAAADEMAEADTEVEAGGVTRAA